MTKSDDESQKRILTAFEKLALFDSVDDRIGWAMQQVEAAERRYNELRSSELAQKIREQEERLLELQGLIQEIDLPDVYEIDSCMASAMDEMRRFSDWVTRVQKAQKKRNTSDEDYEC